MLLHILISSMNAVVFTEMKLCLLVVVTLMSLLTEVVLGADKKKLQIGIKKRVENCPIKSRKGDVLNMHYTVGTHVYSLV